MSTDTKHLWQRGNQWHLKLAIPRSLQKHFPSSTGKPKSHIVEPLGDSLTQARLHRNRLVTAYEEVFARLRAGEVMTPDQITAAVKLDLELLSEQYKADALRMIPIGFRRFAAKYSRDDEAMFDIFEIEKIAQKLNIPIEKFVQNRNQLLSDDGSPAFDSDLYKMFKTIFMHGRQSAYDTAQAKLDEISSPATPPLKETAETISQAAEAWFAQTQHDPSTATKQTTIDGHRQRVRAFVERCGDLPLASVTRAIAADFLAAIGKSNRTINNYMTTLACVFRSAKIRGRFFGDNPFEQHRRKVSKKTNRVPFELGELQTLFEALPREIQPARHTPETALSWVTLIGAFTGMRLEEISQLTAADIRVENTNGGTTTVIAIHNGTGNQLKNESAVRLVPVHSELVRAGLLEYIKALPTGSMLFPGLTRRKSKGDKIGARIGELFRKKLESLNLKRDGLCFHSLRHTVAGQLDAAGVRKTDAARILGHTIEGQTFGTYSDGPGIKMLAGVIEMIRYPSLKL
jgi:integrase